MIKAIVIDDDLNLRKGMKVLLTSHEPQIEVVGEAESVASGIVAIEKHQPQVVFLDIQMNDGTGFDLLEQLIKKYGKISAHIVFITAHEQFAIKAFRFSALDYLLKPVDIDELKIVIQKIKKAINETINAEPIDLLLNNLSKKEERFTKIALTTSEGMFIVEIKNIIHCESESNYTKFYLKNQKPILISKTLKEYEDLLSEHGFERIHQSHLVNLNEIKAYLKHKTSRVILSNETELPVSQRKKERIEKLLLNKELSNSN